MKKAFYMMAAAAIALSSCSSEETTDVAKSSSITFRTSVGLNSRGTATTTENLRNIWVSAFYKTTGSAFEDVKFINNGGTSTSFFDENNNHYWEKNRTYRFIAIAPIKTDWATTSSFSKDEVTFTGVSPKTTIPDQQDLVIGNADGSEATNATAGVTLNLKHVLSQIKIQALNRNPNLIYTIRGIRISTVATSGDLKYTTESGDIAWTKNGAALSNNAAVAQTDRYEY
ncbi:MAG: fimbrillin family protein, partial [Prevotella sp.]|nr:fimbrillin family protein [Prevotella sp.]